MILKSTLFCAWLTAGTLCVAAQTGTTGQAGTTEPPRVGAAVQAHQGLMLQRGDKLIGVDVKDSTGARIGRVEDIILKTDGTIAYAVLTGTEGQSLYPVPWHSLRVTTAPAAAPARPGEPATLARPGDFTLTLTGVDAARWRTAPHFEPSAWPKDTDRSVFTQSDAFFGPGSGGRPIDASADAKLASSSPFFRASKLQNQPIVDSSGQPIGRFGTLVFDPTAGRLNYTAISLEEANAANPASSRVIAVPWETLRATRQDEKDRFQFNVTKDRLSAAPQFSTGDDNWKKMSDPKWVNEMYTYYSVRPYWSTPSMHAPDKKPAPAGDDKKPVGGG